MNTTEIKNPYICNNLPNFIGRKFELDLLKQIDNKAAASIILVTGRRRVGKTQLIEQYFQKHKVIKFEGIQPSSKTTGSVEARGVPYQIKQSAERLAKYTGEQLYAKLDLHAWREFFEILDPYVRKDSVVLYFEETQWLADYDDAFFAELKPYWDESWHRNPNLKLVICGSAPSFLTEQFLGDKALYARSTNTINLKPFTLNETAGFLDGIGKSEVLQAQILIGGIPEYLCRIKDAPSVLTGISRESFLPNAFFADEYDKIFLSSKSRLSHFRSILGLLSETSVLSRDQLIHELDSGNGGSLTNIIDDLVLCSFVAKNIPVGKDKNSKLIKYEISDPFIRFFNNHIRDLSDKIADGAYKKDPLKAVNLQRLAITSGFAFERWCRRNERLFSTIMGFRNVEYSAGPLFNRKTLQTPGFQADLVYIRADKRITACEIKYGSSFDLKQTAAKLSKTAEQIKSEHKYKNYTIETCLITPELANKLKARELFQHVILLDEIMNPVFWELV